MDFRSCCGAASRCSSETIHLGSQQQPPPYGSASKSGKPVKWRRIWTRLVKEKRGGHHVDQFQVPSYDSYNYAQNFDQGVAWDEPENISRSFSVRFANPAQLSQNYSKKNSGRTAVEVS